MFYPSLKNENPVVLEMTTKDGEIKQLKNTIEKNEHEKFLKSVKRDIDYYKTKYQNLNKNKIIF